jgi:hypothetical protein
LGYTIPATGDRAEVFVTAPAAVGQLMMFLPDDGTSVTTQNLKSAGTMPFEGGRMVRCYMASNLEAGESAALTVGDLSKAPLSTPTPVADGVARPETSKPAAFAPTLPQKIAVAGTIAIVVLGTAVLFLRGSKKNPPAKQV